MSLAAREPEAAAARLRLPMVEDFALLPIQDYPRFTARARCPRGCGSNYWHLEGGRQDAVDSLLIHARFCPGRKRETA